MWKNEASGNSAEFCFDKWPHWPHWQTLTVLVNDRATDVCVSYSSDSSLHCLPIACCCPFPAALLGAGFVWALGTKRARETPTVCFNGLHHFGWFCLNPMTQALLQIAAADQQWCSQSRQLTTYCQPWWPWCVMREIHPPQPSLPFPVTFKYHSLCLLLEAEILRIRDCAALLQSSCDLLPPLYFQWVHSMWRQLWVKYCPNNSFRHLLLAATGLQPYWELV